MAQRSTEVPVLGPGIVQSGPNRGSFAKNMFKRDGAWEVRKGFGQMDEFDTTFTLNPDATPGTIDDWGYQEHMGSYLMRTNFGHDQIITVLKANVLPTDIEVDIAQESIYCVSIYDITTGNRWEEPIYKQTIEDELNLMLVQYPQYMSNYQVNYQRWVTAVSSESFWFAEAQDVLWFGNPDTGVMCYYPSAFSQQRRQFLNRHSFKGHQPVFWGESGVVKKAVTSDGAFRDSRVYLNEDEFPSPTAAVAFGDAVVYASGRAIYFSDSSNPKAIIADNVLSIGSREEVTALARLQDDLVIFTQDETYHYRPSNGAIASAGVLSRLSDQVGCIGRHAVASVDGGVMWVDANGVYTLSGFQIEKLSDPIDSLFNDELSDPMTSYIANSGGTTIGNAQPNRLYRFTTDPKTQVTWSPSEEFLLITQPSNGYTLCYSEGSWSIWTYETSAIGGSDAGSVSNIDSPWPLPSLTGLYIAAGPSKQLIEDDINSGKPVEDAFFTGYYILEYGRGGATDRSVDGTRGAYATEDSRMLMGKYYQEDTYTDVTGRMVLDKWIRVPEGFEFTNNNRVAAEDEVYLLPIKVIPGTNFQSGLFQIDFRFQFDNSHWEPIFRSGATSAAEIDFVLPAERMDTFLGYNPDNLLADPQPVAVFNGRGVICIDSTTGNLSATGDEIRIQWDAGDAYTLYGAGNRWEHASTAATLARMNTSTFRENLLLYIPMRKKSTSYNTNLSGMGLSFSWTTTATTQAFVAIDDRVTNTPLAKAWWEQYSPDKGEDDITQGVRRFNSTEQAVDWCYMSGPIGLDDQTTFKLRGLYARVLHHGESGREVVSSHLGLFNVLSIADRKIWTGQLPDYNNTLETNAVASQIDLDITKRRIRNGVVIGGDNVEAVFNNNSAFWGDSADSTAGTVLIDDEKVDEVAISSMTKGQEVQVMMFGHMLNKAHEIKLASCNATLRPVSSGRRRLSRGGQ